MPLPCAVKGVLYRVMTLFSQTLVHDHMIAGSDQVLVQPTFLFRRPFRFVSQSL